MILLWMGLLFVFIFVMTTWVIRPVRSFKYEDKDGIEFLWLYAREKTVFRGSVLALFFGLLTIGMVGLCDNRSTEASRIEGLEAPNVKRKGDDPFVDMGKPSVETPETVFEYQKRFMENN